MAQTPSNPMSLNLNLKPRRDARELSAEADRHDPVAPILLEFESPTAALLARPVPLRSRYMTWVASSLFFVMVFFLGVGGANFAMYTLWIPEQYATECRGSAIGFTSSIGRFVGCGMVFLVGAGVASYGSLGVPVAMTALAFAVGLFFLPFAEETRGKPLPI